MQCNGDRINKKFAAANKNKKTKNKKMHFFVFFVLIRFSIVVGGWSITVSFKQKFRTMKYKI
jgi:hypothetical protein